MRHLVKRRDPKVVQKEREEREEREARAAAAATQAQPLQLLARASGSSEAQVPVEAVAEPEEEILSRQRGRRANSALP